MHLEGALEPELAFALARRNAVRLRAGTVEELRASYRFSNLQAFLGVYYEVASVLVTAVDFHDLTRAYLERARRDNFKSESSPAAAKTSIALRRSCSASVSAPPPLTRRACRLALHCSRRASVARPA